MRRIPSLALAAAVLVTAGLLPSPARAAAPPPWFDLPLVDVRTGETFTLGDHGGRTVLVQAMATWCTTCRRQMTIVREVVDTLDPEAFVFVGLSVETALSDDALRAYVDAQGFDWAFAVMSPELLRSLAGTFGPTIANPPATPQFVIRPDGSVAPLTTGILSADAIREALLAAADAR